MQTGIRRGFQASKFVCRQLELSMCSLAMRCPIPTKQPCPKDQNASAMKIQPNPMNRRCMACLTTSAVVDFDALKRRHHILPEHFAESATDAVEICLAQQVPPPVDEPVEHLFLEKTQKATGY